MRHAPLIIADILVAGARSFSKRKLAHNILSYQPVEISVDCSFADRCALLPEMIGHIIGRYMFISVLN
jgi:hypothetical protein